MEVRSAWVLLPGTPVHSAGDDAEVDVRYAGDPEHAQVAPMPLGAERSGETVERGRIRGAGVGRGGAWLRGWPRRRIPDPKVAPKCGNCLNAVRLGA